MAEESDDIKLLRPQSRGQVFYSQHKRFESECAPPTKEFIESLSSQQLSLPTTSVVFAFPQWCVIVLAFALIYL